MLPEDKNMLLSVINMKLRDQYDSLEELCEDMDEDRDSIIKKLDEAGYIYSEKRHAFVPG